MILQSDLTARKLSYQNPLTEYESWEDFLSMVLVNCAKTRSHFKIRQITWNDHNDTSFSVAFEASYYGKFKIGNRPIHFTDEFNTTFRVNFDAKNLSKSLLITLILLIKKTKKFHSSNISYDFDSDTFIVGNCATDLFKDRLLCVKVTQIPEKDKVVKQLSYLPKTKLYGLELVDFPAKTEHDELVCALKGTDNKYPFDGKANYRVIEYKRFLRVCSATERATVHRSLDDIIRVRWHNWQFQPNGLELINTSA